MYELSLNLNQGSDLPLRNADRSLTWYRASLLPAANANLGLETALRVLGSYARKATEDDEDAGIIVCDI